MSDPAVWITRVAEADRPPPAEGPLHGMTLAVKDNIDVAGLPTTAACPAFARTPARDATAVARLRAAGMVIAGKTNLDQFATGLVGVRSPYGIPRNAFSAAHVPGGSSSGSAVAVATGLVDAALGTDTAGSGRVPAMFGNIVGLKPTIGSVSAGGMVPACRSIDTISVFAASVDQALALALTMSGHDDADPYSRRAPFDHLRRAGQPDGARLAAIDPVGCDPEVARLYVQTAARLGAETIDVAPFLAVARLLYDGPWVAERTAALRHLIAMDALHPVTRRIIEGGLSRLTVDAFDAFHQLAEARRLAERLFARCDALLLPTAPFTPTLAELEADPIGPNSRLGTYTNFVNLCDLAAIAVPAGLGADGLPVGITVVGPAWSEGRIAPIADSIHRAASDRIGATRRPLPGAAAPDPVGAGETALFCIGAHMAGLPLNGQVTSLGGRFWRAARTTPAYRLFALGGRPGLVRAEAGGSIEGEIWILPTSAIGPLLAQVPPPLGFGTVSLADGPCLGFLAEAHAIAGAPDITGLGGWRAYQTKMR